MSRMSYMRQLYRYIRRDLLLCHIASCDVIWCHIMSCDVFKLDITSVATNSAKSPSQRAVVSYYITWRHMISHDITYDVVWCWYLVMDVWCLTKWQFLLLPVKWRQHMSCDVIWHIYRTSVPKEPRVPISAIKFITWCHLMSYDVICRHMISGDALYVYVSPRWQYPGKSHHMTSYDVT